jgi:transcriptional regulator with XRE-family HTH domain
VQRITPRKVSRREVATYGILSARRDENRGGSLRVAELIGANLKALRRAAGLTQTELAEAMEVVGFRWVRQTVAETEAGRRDMTVEELAAIAAIFEMPLYGVIATPGGLITQRWSEGVVEVGNRSLRFQNWLELVAQVGRSPQEPASPRTRHAIDSLVGSVHRPWTRLWRRMGGGPGKPFMDARDKRFRTRSRLPGPIFVWEGDGDMEVATTVPPWSAHLRVKLKNGTPYVARDEQEAELILEAMNQYPQLRMINRQEAYRLRRKGARLRSHRDGRTRERST